MIAAKAFPMVTKARLSETIIPIQQNVRKPNGSNIGGTVERLHTVFDWMFDPVNLTAVATFVIAAFTIILAVVGYCQARLIRKSIDLARAEFISSHRPRLRVRSIDRSTSNPVDYIGVQFAVVNVGDTEAHLLGSRVVVDFFPEKPPIDFTGTDAVEPRRFLPGASDSYAVTSSRKWLILQSEYNAARHLFVHGQIVYRNDLGTTYTTSFCRIWNVAANRFKRTDDPDYEYED